MAEFKRVSRGKVVLTIAVSRGSFRARIKDIIRPLIFLKPMWKIKPSGNISEKNLFCFFHEFGFDVLETLLVDNKNESSYKFYVLTKNNHS